MIFRPQIVRGWWCVGLRNGSGAGKITSQPLLFMVRRHLVELWCMVFELREVWKGRLSILSKHCWRVSTSSWLDWQLNLSAPDPWCHRVTKMPLWSGHNTGKWWPEPLISVLLANALITYSRVPGDLRVDKTFILIGFYYQPSSMAVHLCKKNIYYIDRWASHFNCDTKTSLCPQKFSGPLPSQLPTRSLSPFRCWLYTEQACCIMEIVSTIYFTQRLKVNFFKWWDTFYMCLLVFCDISGSFQS